MIHEDNEHHVDAVAGKGVVEKQRDSFAHGQTKLLAKPTSNIPYIK